MMTSLTMNNYFNLVNPSTQLLAKVALTEILNDKRLVCLLQSVNAYSQDLWKHSLNVMMLTLMTAREFISSKQDLIDITLGGLFHDLGKTYIPLEILNKPFRLTQEEFETISLHPIFGYFLLKDSDLPDITLEMVKYHHHNSGYPEGAPSLGQLEHISIIALADAYDAMTSSRPYQRRKKPLEATLEIKKNLGNQFDLFFGEAFIRLITRENLDKAISSE